MSAELKAVDFKQTQASDQARSRSATNMGSDAAYTETWPWRPEGEGKAPIQIKIRPFVLMQDDLKEIDRAAEEAQTALEVLQTERAKLKEKETELTSEMRVESLVDDLPEEETGAYQKLKRISARIAEIDKDLETKPDRLHVVAEKLIIPVVESWPLTYIDDAGDEVVIPLEPRKIVKEMQPVKFQAFRRDLQDFLFSGRFNRKKR